MTQLQTDNPRPFPPVPFVLLSFLSYVFPLPVYQRDTKRYYRPHNNLDYKIFYNHVMDYPVETNLIFISLNSYFLLYSYYEQTSFAFPCSPSMRYHTYLIPHRQKLQDAPTFPYNCSLRNLAKHTALFQQSLNILVRPDPTS